MKTKTVKYLDTENEIWKKHLVFIARYYVKLKAYLPILIFVFLVFVTNSPFQLFESKQYSHQCVRYFTFWSLGHSFAFLFLAREVSEEYPRKNHHVVFHIHIYIFTDPSHHDPSSCPLVLPGHLRDHRRFQRRAEVGPQGPRRCECAGFALRGANYVSVKAAGGDELSSIHIDPTDSTLTSPHLTAPFPCPSPPPLVYQRPIPQGRRSFRAAARAECVGMDPSHPRRQLGSRLDPRPCRPSRLGLDSSCRRRRCRRIGGLRKVLQVLQVLCCFGCLRLGQVIQVLQVLCLR